MKNKTLVKDIFLLTCYIFAPISLILNIILGITIGKSSLLSIGGIFLILLISFTVSSFLVVIRDKGFNFTKKSKILSLSMCFFTCISFVINAFVQLFALSVELPIKNLWNIYSILLILAFSFCISVCISWLKTQNIILKILIYFFLIGIFYFLLTVTIGSLAIGNTLFIFLGIYILVYALITAAYLLIVRRKRKIELEKKPYQKQF